MSGYQARTLLGRRGERLAAQHYERLGGSVLERSFRTGQGELDLVVALNGTLVFAEVKTRTQGALHPLEAVTTPKRLRLRRMAVAWLACRNPPRARTLRFDLVAIVINRDGELVSLEQCEILE